MLSIYHIGKIGYREAINATTVEVAFKEAVKDIASVRFAIEGLEVKNAAVKQTDNKTVVITTSTQEGAKDYTLKNGGYTLGKFKGVSAVVPKEIKLLSTSAQSKVGKEVTLKADIGVKAAGVPVTFNVDAEAGSINKDQVVEVFTNADGIAEFTYTQYAAGQDLVAVYPTGAPTVRALSKVYWGADDILTISAADTKGDALTNGEKKTYKVVYKDAVTGKGVSNKELKVTLKENVDVPFNTISKVTVTDLATGNAIIPYQTASGTQVLTIKTDVNGVATFTVTGTNTSATPVVFADIDVIDTNNDGKFDKGNDKLDDLELLVVAPKVSFVGAQEANTINVTAALTAEAAEGATNGRIYTVEVKGKDGKAYNGGVVNVAINEEIDNDRNTVSSALIKDDADADKLLGSFVGPQNVQQTQLKLDKDGKAQFIVYGNDDVYATPIVWIDQNDSVNNQTGKLETGEPFKVAETTNFQTSRVIAAKLEAVNAAGKKVTSFKGDETATFNFYPTNQSDKKYTSAALKQDVTFEIINTGENALTVESTGYVYGTNNADANGKVIEVGGKLTITAQKGDLATFNLKATDPAKATSAKVSASSRTTNYSTDERNNNKYLTADPINVTFTSTAVVSDFFTGNIAYINTVDEKIYFAGKSEPVSYKEATFTGVSGADITKDGFKLLLASDQYTATYTKDSNGKVKIDLVRVTTPNTATPVTTLSSIGDGTVALTGSGTKINSIPVGGITVTDSDANASSTAVDTVTVTVDATGSVPVTLTETGANTGVFKNATAVDLSTLTDGTLTVTYTDAVNTTGASKARTATATLDTTAPTAATLGDGTAAVTIAAGATSTITFSEALNAASKTAVENALTASAGATAGSYSWNAANTVITITGATGAGTTFATDVAVTLTDVVGNSSAAPVVIVDKN
ncbi:hypothetical protein [Metabacillus fastidiosus]|uniref:hypothetical protein n=1 Tax=Metabacillus fastidiosus TaxID=1458 RepID=UPI003D281CF7